jgi:phosphonoacetaldehyde hydrolase
VDVFEAAGVPITMREARLPIGLRNDLHIQKITEIPSVRERWEDAKGSPPSQEDCESMFADFVPKQLACLSEHSDFLPGVNETIDRLRKEYNVKIGMTTGFTEVMTEMLPSDMKKQGCEPDTSVAGDQVPEGLGVRPLPFMVWQNLFNLGVWPIQSVLKVDDTNSGIGEGNNAGCWTVALSDTSNYTDIDSLSQWEEMSDAERRAAEIRSMNHLIDHSNAHYVCDNIKDLPDIVGDINDRLAKGERP